MNVSRFAFRMLLWLLIVSLCSVVLGCEEPEDTVGGGGCEDEYDVILKGEVEMEDGDEDFKAKLNYLPGDEVEGDIKWDDDWQEVFDGIGSHSRIKLYFYTPNPLLWSSCQGPPDLLYVMDLESENGLAGPFEGEMKVYCGLSEDGALEIGTPRNAEGEVTCEDL